MCFGGPKSYSAIPATILGFTHEEQIAEQVLGSAFVECGSIELLLDVDSVECTTVCERRDLDIWGTVGTSCSELAQYILHMFAHQCLCETAVIGMCS